MVGIGHCRIFARSNVILNDKTNIKSEPKWPNRDIVEEHEAKLSIIFSSIMVGGWNCYAISKSDEVQIIKETLKSGRLTQMSTEIFILTNIVGQTSKYDIQNGCRGHFESGHRVKYSSNHQTNIKYEFLELNNP